MAKLKSITMNTISTILLSVLLLFSSCNSDDPFGNEGLDESCNDSLGSVSVSISGSKNYSSDCVYGTTVNIGDISVFYFVPITEAFLGSSKNKIDQYLTATLVIDSNLNGECIDQNKETYALSIQYFEDYQWQTGGQDNADEAIYSTTKGSYEICYEVNNSNRIKGTFSATLVNEMGDRKEINNGAFNIKL